MSDFVTVAAASDIPEGDLAAFDVEDHRIAEACADLIEQLEKRVSAS